MPPRRTAPTQTWVPPAPASRRARESDQRGSKCQSRLVGTAWRLGESKTACSGNAPRFPRFRTSSSETRSRLLFLASGVTIACIQSNTATRHRTSAIPFIVHPAQRTSQTPRAFRGSGAERPRLHRHLGHVGPGHRARRVGGVVLRSAPSVSPETPTTHHTRHPHRITPRYPRTAEPGTPAIQQHQFTNKKQGDGGREGDTTEGGARDCPLCFARTLSTTSLRFPPSASSRPPARTIVNGRPFEIFYRFGGQAPHLNRGAFGASDGRGARQCAAVTCAPEGQDLRATSEKAEQSAGVSGISFFLRHFRTAVDEVLLGLALPQQDICAAAAGGFDDTESRARSERDR